MIYDDVERSVTTTTNIVPPSFRPQELNVTPQVSTAPSDDIYDEAESKPSLLTSPIPVTPIPTPPISMPPITQPTKSVIDAPLKTEKTFQPLPAEKMKMPYGLDKWLEDMVIANRTRLKRLDSNGGNDNTLQFVPPPRAPVQPPQEQGE